MDTVKVLAILMSLALCSVPSFAHAESPAIVAPFVSDLRLGSIDPQVVALQQYLNAHGFVVATEGPGSVSNETDYFGTKTRAALIAFQEAHRADILTPLGLTSGTGNFFSVTRAYVNGTLSVAAPAEPVKRVTSGRRSRGGGTRSTPAPTYVVGGTASGIFGSGLVLDMNGSSNLTVLADGSFTFSETLLTGASYSVTVLAQPTSPAQTCGVTNGAGTMGSEAVSSVEVTCVTHTHLVTPQDDGHASVSPDIVQAINDGATASFVVTADTGYARSTSVSGTCPAGSWEGNTYTTGLVTGDCTVSFSTTPISYPLSITKTGNATGQVASSPAGISCGSTCTASYPYGTDVSLTATPDPGVNFGGWSGGGCSGTGFCTVTITATTTVSAQFFSLFDA